MKIKYHNPFLKFLEFLGIIILVFSLIFLGDHLENKHKEQGEYCKFNFLMFCIHYGNKEADCTGEWCNNTCYTKCKSGEKFICDPEEGGICESSYIARS